MNESHSSTVTFETALGRCAVRWSEVGITGVLLPRAGGRPGPPFEVGVVVPAFVGEAIEGIVAVMDGERRDLSSIPLDERGIDDFRRAVYAATRDIPAGHDPELRRGGPGDRPARRSEGRRRGACPQPVPDHRPVPPGGRRERGTHRVLGTGRPRDEAPDARARGRAGLRPAGPLRSCTSVAPRFGWSPHREVGGDEGTRTPDPCDANAVLFQLSYIPTGGRASSADGGPVRNGSTRPVAPR